MTVSNSASAFADRAGPSFGKRLLALAEWLALGLLTWYSVSWLTRPDTGAQPDFIFFYAAGWQMVHGLSPYDFVVTEWGVGFVYPPWLALLMMPLAVMPYGLAAILWFVINLVLLAATVVLAERLCSLRLGLRRITIVFLAIIFWGPSQTHFFLGSCTLPTATAAVGAVLALHRGHARLAGLLLVIAAIKPQLVFLLGSGLTVWEWRQRRSVGVPLAFAGGMIASLLACLAIAPDWIGDLLARERQPWDYWGVTTSTRTLLAAPAGPDVLTEGLSLSVLVIGSGAVLACWARSDRSLVELAALTLAATLLISPYAHVYDYVVLVLPLMMAGARVMSGPEPGRRWRLAALVIASWALVSIDAWVRAGIEQAWVWEWLEERFGEDAVTYVWYQSKWNWRFIAMSVPLGLTMLLSWPRSRASQPRRDDRTPGAPVGVHGPIPTWSTKRSSTMSESK